MKKRVYRLVTGMLTVLWMVVIFRFSAQPATKSQEISGTVSYRAVVTCNQILNLRMTEGQITLRAEQIDYPIRKVAHMTEYAVLAIFIGACFIGYRKWETKTYWLSLLLTACYAATDEVHQLFVEGRAGRFSDVCIDSVGAAIGLVLFGIVLKIVGKHCEKGKLPLK